MEKIFKEVDKIINPLPSLGFDIVKTETTNFDTKLGGLPYWPKDMKYPVDEDGETLDLLVQLNFNELPHIKDFPEHGILQIFIGSDCYGSDYSNPTNQSNFKVIYHENIVKGNLLETLPEHSEDYYEELPFRGEYKLVPLEVKDMYVDAYDYRFGEIFCKIYNKSNEDNPIESLYELEDELADSCYERNDRPIIFIGGYPIFAQDDPRDYNDDIKDCNIVLFESDSIYDKSKGLDIMWGDSGTGAFLIPLENLKKLDFSRVAYNFDCC